MRSTGGAFGTEILASAVDALRSGLIVGVPTDTVYGIGADPFCESAVAALFATKGRPGIKPIPILVASIWQARLLAAVDERAGEAAARYWPGPLTLVLPRAPGMPAWVGDPERDTVGVRVPDHPGALALLKAFGPVAVTSANRTGEGPPSDDEGARAAFGGLVAVYLPGAGAGLAASTVVDLSGPEPVVLRQGPSLWEQSPHRG
jgi:L-threonylcarbamoyladenylate synthase